MAYCKISGLVIFLALTSILRGNTLVEDFDARYLTDILPEPDGKGVQDDSWSCGPNALSKILRYYYHDDATYYQVRAFAEPKVKVLPLLNIKLGTDANLAKEILNNWDEELRGTYLEQAAEDNIISELSKNNPVAVLVHLGPQYYSGVKVPLMHWIVLTGYSIKRNAFKVMDSNDTQYWMSEQEFISKWDFNFNEYGLAVKAAIAVLAHKARTLVFLEVP